MDEIRELAEPLAGKRVVHLSATAFGGGVAEINYTLVPLMQDAGLEVEWRIIRGADDFFNVTKTIHNAIQGDPHGLSDSHKEIFRRYQELNAREFTDDYDFVIVHDPQPVGLIEHFPDSKAQVDLARPHRLLGAEPGRARFPAPVAPPLRRGDLPPRRVRAASGVRHGVRLAARDRPARAEEHGAVAGGRRVHRRPVRASTSSGRC